MNSSEKWKNNLILNKDNKTLFSKQFTELNENFDLTNPIIFQNIKSENFQSIIKIINENILKIETDITIEVHLQLELDYQVVALII